MKTAESTQKTALRRYDPLLLRVVPPIVALAVKLLMKSCRVVEVKGFERVKAALAESGGKAIYPTWHQRMSYHFHLFGPKRLTVMISQSRDGEYAARVAKWLGFNAVRGSSTRNGATALREIIRRIKEGENTGMLADGPLGPARVAKVGPILMARSAGVPLVPVVWGADRCWVFNSWDRYLTPKPFARVVIRYAEPILVPRSAKGEELERYRRLLEERLNEETRRCDRYFGEERPWRKVKREGLPDVGPIGQNGRKKEVENRE